MSSTEAIEAMRVCLRPIGWDAVLAVTERRRLPGWADDFPDGGDRVIAGILARRGAPESEEEPWSHSHVIERDSGLVVGGAGFLGPPRAGEVEIGYGIVPSRRGRGYATEAVGLLLAHAWDRGVRAITARTEAENRDSQRVLEKAGFGLVTARDGTRDYRNPPER